MLSKSKELKTGGEEVYKDLLLEFIFNWENISNNESEKAKTFSKKNIEELEFYIQNLAKNFSFYKAMFAGAILNSFLNTRSDSFCTIIASFLPKYFSLFNIKEPNGHFYSIS